MKRTASGKNGITGRIFQQFRNLPPQEAEQWREKYRDRGLSPEEKRTLRDRLRGGTKDGRFRSKDDRH
jgi:hypothetical protein